MAKSNSILDRDGMRKLYGKFYQRCSSIRLDVSKIPPELHVLLPYVEFWGISDDYQREKLVTDAPPAILENLQYVVNLCDDMLDEWLSGPESESPSPSDEYIAFSAMRMAADFA